MIRNPLGRLQYAVFSLCAASLLILFSAGCGDDETAPADTTYVPYEGTMAPCVPDNVSFSSDTGRQVSLRVDPDNCTCGSVAGRDEGAAALLTIPADANVIRVTGLNGYEIRGAAEFGVSLGCSDDARFALVRDGEKAHFSASASLSRMCTLNVGGCDD